MRLTLLLILAMRSHCLGTDVGLLKYASPAAVILTLWRSLTLSVDASRLERQCSVFRPRGPDPSDIKVILLSQLYAFLD